MRTRAQLLSALLLGPIGAIADCSHNNCLRAVIGDAFPTRNGAADCSSYLRVTVTPPTSTFTVTQTVPTLIVESSTVVDVSTAIETVVASTETDYFEGTATIEQTSTEIDVSTTTRTVDPNGLAARQATASGSAFPAYASPCTSFAKYASACSCLSYFPDTITVAAPSTTITVVSTSSSTSTEVTTTSTTATLDLSVTETTLITSTVSVSTTDATTTTSTTATAVATNIVKNGRFENQLTSWTITRDSQVSASTVRSGSNSVLKTGNMYNNNLFEMRQLLNGVSGTTYTCHYDWLFTNYYATQYRDGNTYVPYIHVYMNDVIFDNVTPEPPNTPGQWYTSTFTFTSSGGDTLWFDCASPQARTGSGGGANYLSLDNVSCVAS
ncbi:hypothetical protein CONLIGDRAFT_630639 [Coniochaeta ligniaria NRRL 30616]|uniref:CBM-cenC domain-containing protein n=1 Tax=Coniochaeta ligniaria NRRL 30616 TaxID=1408157 RepID=A0A1J7JBL5_9PEZI|nr:hypothetical protein CONLIGDRAFT_630639 [Coniochaeta ligniaria NRRL 30616]